MKQYERIGSSGDYTLLYSPGQKSGYIWALNVRWEDRKRAWDKAICFDSLKEALKFKSLKRAAVEDYGRRFDSDIERNESTLCDCQYCGDMDCVHRGAYRRTPKTWGGLGLCKNLS